MSGVVKIRLAFEIQPKQHSSIVYSIVVTGLVGACVTLRGAVFLLV